MNMKKKIILFLITLIIFMLIFILNDLFLGIGHSTNTKTLSEIYLDWDKYFWISLIFATGILFIKSKEK